MMSQRIGGVLVILCILSCRPAAGQEWKPARLWVAGSDVSTWVVGASQGAGSNLPVVKIWFADKNAEPSVLKQSQQPPAVVGDPQYVTADVGGLRILFNDLTACDYFGVLPYSPGANWKEQCHGRPLAWAGDVSQPVLYAVVRTDELITVAPATSEAENESPPSDPSPSTVLTVLQLRGGLWRRLAAPAEAVDVDAVWIAGRDALPRFFFRRKGQVYAVATSNEAWSKPQRLPIDDPVDAGWATITPNGAAFLVGQRDDEGRLKLHLYLEREGQWSGAGGVREGNELAAIDPTLQGIGLLRGHIAIARATTSGGIELGLAPIGPDPALRFTNLSVTHREQLTRPPWEEGVTLALLLGILTMAMWTRRETAVRTIELPAGLTITPIWKRAAAALVDILPAILLTAPWWYPKSVAFMLDNGPILTPEQTALLDATLRFEKYSTILVYGLWGFVWEAATGRTPGKMLLGCRVISIVTPSPTVRQCLIRNLVRSFMVSLGPSGLLVTLMTMLIVSRNRQRVGDLLAYTLVVEPSMSPVQPPEAPPEEESDPGE